MSLRQTIRLNFPRANRLTSGPELEPVTLNELKVHLRIDGFTEDDYLVSLIQEARRIIEDRLGVAMISQSWQLTLDTWPVGAMGWWDGEREGALSALQTPAHLIDLEIPRWPLQSITSVTVYDDADVATVVVVADTFHVDLQSTRGRITLKDGAAWPVALRSSNAIEIVYVAGYGASELDVPNDLARAVKQLAAMLYSNRGDCSGGELFKQSGVESLLSIYQIKRV